ncbi:hypothetical protein D4764_07G0000580, partial [Takifugu flavidus]
PRPRAWARPRRKGRRRQFPC